MDLDGKCEISTELLFFDTFAHESDQESNLDLVQFASPIIIDEIRIIPLGARVEADFPGGVRLGATNPSSFNVTFYINDFTKPTLCTFSDFGRFDYKQNINIQFVPEERKPTDGLLIKGSYRTLTLAIFGVQTNVKDIIVKEETQATTPVTDPLALISDNQPNVDADREEFPFSDKKYTENSPDLGKESNLISERLNPAVIENQQATVLRSSSDSKSNTNNNNNKYYSERTKDSASELRSVEINSTSVNNRDENLVPRQRLKLSPCSRQLISNSPPTLSPVRSPQSLKSPMSPQSDISLKSETILHNPRSPIMDHAKSISSRSPYNRGRTAPSTHSNHSPRSPRYIQSRSPSPWYKNQHNASRPSSPPSPLSSKYRKAHSPTKITSPAKTPPELPSASKFNKKRQRHTRSSSRSCSPLAKNKRLEIESDSGLILPVSTDLLEEISPEHSLSDWAESISEDENLDDMESGDDESHPNNNISSINSSKNDNYFIHSPNHHQPSESQEPEPFESISSEEEYFEEGNIEEGDRLSHYSGYDLSDNPFNLNFDPFNCEFPPLRMLRDPAQTNYQYLRNSQMNFNENKRTLLLSQLNEIDGRSSIWVETMEQIAKDIELIPLEEQNVLDIVLVWLKDGLDFDLAVKQTTIPYKVRHLKAGIKLCIALTNTDESIVKKLIELKIPLTLMDLYHKPHMSLPLKLLILRTFDAFCDSVTGIEHILNDKYVFNSLPTDEIAESLTCYQHLLLLLANKPPSRIAIALEALFNKMHFYNLLESFRTVVNNPNINVLTISTYLREIGSTFVSACKLLTQKIRCLPVTCFFEIKEPKCDCFLAIYNWFKHHKFLDNLVTLLKSSDSESLALEIHQLIYLMISEESFPRFLLSACCCPKTNELTSLLVHANNDVYNQNYYVGDRLSYLLQSYSLIDSLIARLKSESFDMTDCDADTEVCTIFRSFHGLICSPIGRECVIKALSSSNNFKAALLPFLSPVNDDQMDHVLYRSVLSEYSVKLCLSMVQFGEHNILHILKNFENNLLVIAKNSQSSKVSSLSDWLKPFQLVKNFSYSEETFKELMTIVKNYAGGASKLKDTEIFKLQPQLITILRILYKLCIPPEQTYHLLEKEPVIELKYYYAIIQVYSQDGLSSILTLLKKLSETYLRPSHQSFALVGDQGSIVMGFVKLAVKLVKEMLRVLIKARGKDFRDATPIPVMLKVYSLMYMFPRSSFAYSTSRETIRDIVDILMFYTQLSLTSSELDPEALAKGVWTKMISEVLQYTFSLPMTFVHGLSLLSELLPLPLPFQTVSPLTEEEVNKMINIRKLWSAHLLGLSSELEKLISNFVISSSPIIQQLLRRVCIQISDLSSPASTMIVRSVLEAVLDSLPTERNSKLSISLLHVLDLLSYLSSHPPFKMAFIHTMHIGGKLDEKYFTIVSKLLKLIREDVSKPVEIQINLLIFAFLQSLCDSDIYLNSRVPTSSLQILSNSLPPRESLKLISLTLLRFLKNSLKSTAALITQSSENSSISSISTEGTPTNLNFCLPVLKVLSLLCSHDFGFIPLKQSIFEEAQTILNTLLVKISDSIKMRCKQSDLIQVINGFVDFIKAFILENGHRTAKLSYKEIVSLFAWESKVTDDLVDRKTSTPPLSSPLVMSNDEQKINSDTQEPVKEPNGESKDQNNQENDSMADISEKKCEVENDKDSNSETTEVTKVNNLHPLLILKEYIESLDLMGENDINGAKNIIKSLLSLLSSPTDEPSGDTLTNIELPVIEPLPLQFSKREVFIVTSNIDQEKLNANFWLSVPTFDDDHHHNPYNQLQSNQNVIVNEMNSNSHLLHETENKDAIHGEKRISFIELCQKYLSSDFNLKKTLENLCQIHEGEGDVANSTSKPLSSVNSVNQTVRRMDSLLPSRESKSFSNVKKSFVAPMRNRGFGRPGSMMHSSRANDPFRSRPPNTSRPPSMHVDDFVALEKSGTNCNSYETSNKRMKLDYSIKIRNSSASGNASNNTGSGANSNLMHNSSRSFGGSGSVQSRSSPSYHNIESYSNRRALLSSSHSHSHQSPLRNNVSSNSTRGSLTRYSKDNYSPPGARLARSGSTGPSSSSQHWTKSNLTNRRDSRDSRDSRSIRSSNNR
ncbi:protein virilizer homolog [Tetranychus urticae]|uniref:Virilizer N-terminal domain-containing protein n=1 Tax=Tetranychus urticae TaxID=32264 RepID=T1KER9_TETUR|nr:protein virilizer homolog [Tetranychus urticae]